MVQRAEVQVLSIPLTSEHVGLLFATYTCMVVFILNKLIQKWLVKSLKHSSMHTFQTKRKGDPFPSYCTGKCCTIQHSDHRTELLFYSPVVSFPVKDISLCLIRILYRKTEGLHLSTA